MSDFAVILLAAGGSTRLGTPKQLVPLGGRSLVRRAAETALRSGARQVVVVVGASQEQVRDELRDLPVEVAANARWQAGMGGSVACGIGAVAADVDVAVLMLCDMPKVTAGLLAGLAAAVTDGAPVAAACYGDALGVPAAFRRCMFTELAALTGEEGARSVIRRAPAVTAIPFTDGLFDVDTPDDAALLFE